MKGKKSDSEFISNFISKSIQDGFNTPDLIAARAKTIINEIDEQIKLIEDKKKLRSKLLDVVNAFEKSDNKKKIEESQTLYFLKIKYPDICKNICSKLNVNGINIKDISNVGPELDLIFSIKQLIELNILNKVGEFLMCGENFEGYLKFLERL